MPRNQLERMVFAFLTVLVTVHAFVFYNIYVVNGSTLIAVTGKSGVLDAVNSQGGVYMFGTNLPIWSVILTEFCFAYLLEVVIGSPLSFKIASRVFDPRKNHPMIFETMIICATVAIMCPAMSFIAALIYYPYYNGFDFVGFLASWLKLVCFNFPFAFFSQLFFIQPLIRRLFKILFYKSIKKREALAKELEKNGQKLKSKNETEAISDVIKRIDELKAEEAEETKN